MDLMLSDKQSLRFYPNIHSCFLSAEWDLSTVVEIKEAQNNEEKCWRLCPGVEKRIGSRCFSALGRDLTIESDVNPIKHASDVPGD